MVLDKMQRRPYSVEGYDSAWAKQFEGIKQILSEVFGEKALAIEHVGSTSVPGMKAKPQIDVLLVVGKMEAFEKEREAMAAQDYKNQDNYIQLNTILFYKEQGDKRLVNIHVCVKDSPKVEQFLNVRDYLRTHPDEARAYVELKEKLKTEFPDDYPSYRRGKQAFLEEVERKAKEWKEQG